MNDRLEKLMRLQLETLKEYQKGEITLRQMISILWQAVSETGLIPDTFLEQWIEYLGELEMIFYTVRNEKEERKKAMKYVDGLIERIEMMLGGSENWE